MMIKQLIEGIPNNIGQQEMFEYVLSRFIPEHEGNIVEIGIGHALNTELFCRMAPGRQVIGVDPFELGEMPVSYMYGIKAYNQIKDKYPNLHLIQKSSQDPSVLGNLLGFCPIAFGFLDGLQSVEAVLSDIALMEKLNTTLICIDDANRLTGDSRVPEALEQYKGAYQVTVKGREAWLWR